MNLKTLFNHILSQVLPTIRTEICIQKRPTSARWAKSGAIIVEGPVYVGVTKYWATFHPIGRRPLPSGDTGDYNADNNGPNHGYCEN